jgi:hypothetical protein
VLFRSLAADPLGNADGAARATLDYNANTGRPWISQRSAIHVGYEVRHPAFSVTINMRQKRILRQGVYFERLQRVGKAVD